MLEKQRGIQPLPNIDHSQFDYEEIEKDFYRENPEVSNMEFDAVNSIR